MNRGVAWTCCCLAANFLVVPEGLGNILACIARQYGEAMLGLAWEVKWRVRARIFNCS